jgi:hydrogenase maturation protein HypF
MERQAITVAGVVQGVGFRPFVYALASRLKLSGFVKNRAGSVVIEVEGGDASLRRFREELRSHAPPLSRIDVVEWRPLEVLREIGFRIDESDVLGSAEIFISPDVSVCDDCLAELFDPTNRRYRYPFLNCTNCGPRLTIIESAPYDRERTTMARFQMCAACQAEYDNPRNRRFHAQPTACAVCGPKLEVLKPDGARIATNDPLGLFADALVRGKIGALKGLGGYHLVCDARNERSVSLLRQRKHRDEKPFAIMVPDVESARRICNVSSQELELLESPQGPIVLLRKDSDPRVNEIAAPVAPGNPYLGVMLPYTPLHHLLMAAVFRAPLVITSGNRSDEPIAYDDADAIARLCEIADLFLAHDRPIRVRCDDSVTRVVDGAELPVRRSRGYAPQPIKLPFDCNGPVLAVGGQLKAVFALGRDRQAFLSQHLGDLDQLDAFEAFERDVRLYEELFGVRPKAIAYDLHPDYASTRYARCRANQEGSRLFAVQHHHAHMASCMAENGLDEPVIGVAFDGTGYGLAGTIWGGEFLVGDYSQFSRAAHFRCVCLPGGDRAIREPWRIGIAHLLDAGCGDFPVAGASPEQRRTIERMIARGLNSPLTSSAGRLFDAVAAIAGVRSEARYEGEAAMALEWLATDADDDGVYYPFDLVSPPTNPAPGSRSNDFGFELPFARAVSVIPNSIDTRPMIRAIVNDVHRQAGAKVVSRRFHSTFVEIIAAVCRNIRAVTSLNSVVLSGGVFLNALLTHKASRRLAAEGFRVYRHRQVPPGDGGLCLGQLAVAARLIERELPRSS